MKEVWDYVLINSYDLHQNQKIKLKVFTHGVDLAQLRLTEKRSAGLCNKPVSS